MELDTVVSNISTSTPTFSIIGEISKDCRVRLLTFFFRSSFVISLLFSNVWNMILLVLKIYRSSLSFVFPLNDLSIKLLFIWNHSFSKKNDRFLSILQSVYTSIYIFVFSIYLSSRIIILFPSPGANLVRKSKVKVSLNRIIWNISFCVIYLYIYVFILYPHIYIRY